MSKRLDRLESLVSDGWSRGLAQICRAPCANQHKGAIMHDGRPAAAPWACSGQKALMMSAMFNHPERPKKAMIWNAIIT